MTPPVAGYLRRRRIVDDMVISGDDGKVDDEDNSSSCVGIDLFLSLEIGTNIEIDSLTRVDLIEDEVEG